MRSPVAVEVSKQFAEKTDGLAWQLVLPVGQFRHPRYGTEDNRPEVLRQYAENFHSGAKLQGDPPLRLPITIAHDDKLGAGGWIYDTRVTDRGLEVLRRLTDQGRAAIASDTYPFISADTDPTWTDPVTRRSYRNVLAGCSLVVRPFYKGLEAQLHYSEGPAPLALWADTEDPMTEEERAAQAAAAAAAAGDQAEDEPAGDEAGEPKPTAKQDEADEPADEPAGDEVVDAKQFAELRDEVTGLRLESRTRHYSDELTGHQFGETLLAPGPRQRLVGVLARLSDADASEVIEAVKGLRFYRPGEVGADAEAPATKQFSECEASVAAQLGLSKEDWA